MTNPPRISQQEFLTAMGATNFNTFAFADGMSNMTPEARIAFFCRNAKFDRFGPQFKSDMVIVQKAMEDLADYLGFPDVISYNSALMTEGNKIFFRAPQQPVIPVTASYPFPIIGPQGGPV